MVEYYYACASKHYSDIWSLLDTPRSCSLTISVAFRLYTVLWSSWTVIVVTNRSFLATLSSVHFSTDNMCETGGSCVEYGLVVIIVIITEQSSHAPAQTYYSAAENISGLLVLVDSR